MFCSKNEWDANDKNEDGILHVAQAAGGVDRYIRMLLKYLDKEKFENKGIDYYNNRRYQHRLFIQTPMQAHVSAMNRAA